MNLNEHRFTIIVPLLVFLFNLSGFSAEKVNHKSTTTFITSTDPLDAVANYLSGTVASTSEPVTLNILALRAQFVKDSLKTTTGDGHFDLSSESEYSIDRSPHNKTYFEHQLLALSNYFDAVSKGKLILDYQVYPPADEAAYQMPFNMVYYSGEEDEEKQKQRWSELLRDAVDAAKTDNPDFSNFDAFVIYHAGVGNDFAFDFNETPFDIQSAFIDFETLKETLGKDDPDYQGIDAGNGFYIQEGIILPEQQSQKGIDLGLLGTATLLMGSQLGMPSLFNTQDGRAGIGMWGLMDQGSYNYFGLIPAQPCAWMKLYMGWDEAVTVNTLEDAVLGVSRTTSAPHLIKVPITSTEYFLLENRQEDWNGDNMTFGRDEYGKRAQFDSLGNIAIEEGLRVITRVDEYDYGMPGSGILIWHIDEKVIRDNLESNTINDDPDHRGVDLVECDGPQDIGQQYAMFTPGYGTEAGDYWDPFWSGNISHKYINGERPVSLNPTSIPNSDAYGRAITHIEFSNFSDKDTVMTFSIGNDKLVPNFPQYIGKSTFHGAVSWIDLNNGDEKGIITLAGNGDLFGWKTDGSKIIQNDDSATVTDVSGVTTTYPLAIMASIGDSDWHSLMTGLDWNGDGNQDIAVANFDGVITVLSPTDEDNDGRADILKIFDFNEKLASELSMVGIGSASGHIYWLEFNGEEYEFRKQKIMDSPIQAIHRWAFEANNESHFILTTNSGMIYAIDSAGAEKWRTRAYGDGGVWYPVSSVQQNGGVKHPLIVVSNDGYLTLINSDGAVQNSEIKIGNETHIATPALGDVDLDGVPELLISGETHFYAFEIDNAVSTLNFPVAIENPSLFLYGIPAPIWTGNAESSINSSLPIIATSNGSIYSFDKNGKQIDDYRLVTGGPIASTPAFVQMSPNSNQGMLVAASRDGFVYAWKTEWYNEFAWNRHGSSPNNNYSVVYEGERETTSTDLMPKKRVFCYPNPSEAGRSIIRYSLNDNVDQINIRIYDIAGELVTQFIDGGTFPGDHEVTWDVSNIQSGAYIARVEAQANSGNVVEFIKIAVVK